MQCPRCGYPNEPLASWCAQCGLTLHAEQATPSSPAMGMNLPIEGTWREDAHDDLQSAGAGAGPDDDRPTWLLDTLRAGGAAPLPESAPDQMRDQGYGSVQDRAQGWEHSAPSAPAPAPATEPEWPDISPASPPHFAPPPQSAPPYSAPRLSRSDAFGTPASAGTPYPYPPSAPASTPAVGDNPYAYPAATPSPASAPFSFPSAASSSGPPGGSPGRMIVDAWPERAAVPYVPPPSPMALGHAGHAQPLQPGTALKNGRYRITQRLLVGTAHTPPPNEPPLLIASDTELGNERVLVQELPVITSEAAEMDAWRRTCAERFAVLGQRVGAPRLIDQFADGGHHCLVYELPSGDLLSDRLQRTRGPLDEKQAIGIIVQVLDVLAVYERQYPTFIHGNICPANIVLRPSGQVALIGFSPTLLVHPEGAVPQGAAGGVSGYAAPEQSRGQASPRSDLFSVCAVLHHCVTGAAPSPRSRGMFPLARQVNPNVPLELEDVLSQGLRLASTQRYQTSGELRRALEPLAHGQLTHVPEDLRSDDEPAQLTPVRDARGRLVLPRKRQSQSPVLILGIIVLLIALVGGTTLYVLSPHNSGPTAIATPTINSSTQLFQSEGVGLSGGEFIFDTSGNNTTTKQQGALALNSGDLATAERDFTQAMSQEQDDPEAAIYAADVRVLLDKAPYITVVAAVSYSDGDEAREALQGIYLAQHRTNAFDVLPAGLQVRVLILNSGSDDSSASTAAALLLQKIQQGNAQHLAGIVGWPESAETQAALSTLAPTGLAMISPTATGEHLGGRAAVFFPMVPGDLEQAQELARAATAAPLNAHRILVLSDSGSTTSTNEQKSFLGALGQSGSASAQTAGYTSGDAQSLQHAADLSAQQGDDLIFLACGDTGCDNDSLLLAQRVEERYGTISGAPRILVTHQAFTPALLGMGSSPVAAAVRSDASSLALLDVTRLAAPDEWQAAGIAPGQQPGFATDFVSQFGDGALPNGLTPPDASSILSYDAVRMLLAACAHFIHQQGTTIVYPTSPTQIREDGLLQLFTAAHPFVGVGGAVAYTDTGDLVGKSLAIAALVPRANPGNGPVALPQTVALTGGVQSFCTMSCTPS